MCYLRIDRVLFACYYVIIVILLCAHGGDVLLSCYVRVIAVF